MSIDACIGIPNGLLNLICCLAPGILDLALYLLSRAFDLECRIPRQLASLALGASHHIIDCSIHAIFIQRSTSVDSTLVRLLKAPECYSSASIKKVDAEWLSNQGDAALFQLENQMHKRHCYCKTRAGASRKPIHLIACTNLVQFSGQNHHGLSSSDHLGYTTQTTEGGALDLKRDDAEV